MILEAESIDILSWDWNAWVAFVSDQVQNNEFFATAGFFGILGAMWQYGKGVPTYLWERIERRITFTAHIYQTDEFFGYLEQWLRDNHERSYRNVEVDLEEVDADTEQYHDDYLMRNGLGKYSKVPPKEELKFKQFTDLFFIRRGLFWVRVFKGREKMENVTDLRMAYLNRFELSGIFAKRAINKLLDEVLQYNLNLKQESLNTKIDIYTNSGDYWSTNNEIYPKEIDSVILEGKKDLMKDLDTFMENKAWYKERHIAYKRGYMFYGKPGNGKTTLAMSLSQYLKRNLYMLSITKDVDDRDLQRLFRSLPTNSVLVLEDIDALFGTKRKNKSAQFSFSTLLNCLDGVLSKEDVITIFTTNHPEKLDEALIRKGRIDYKLEVSNPTKRGIEEYLNLFYKEENLEIKEFGGDSISMVDIQDICLNNKFNCNEAVEIINKTISK